MFGPSTRETPFPATLCVLITAILLAAVDFLVAPSLGYVRDHLINGFLDIAQLSRHATDWKEGSLLPMLFVFHIVFAVTVSQVATFWSRNVAKLRRHVLIAGIISLPAVILAFLYDELLYMQIPW